ncbi:MAG TPA: nuclear transport factor 2 family protein [Gemmatimonadales bacterium]|nr:nuclear transport factor 2 family protein [Gemmatimonadales bacterium]
MALALLLSLTTLAAAQTDTASDAAVRRTIEQHYFAAHASGSGEPLRGVFVEDGRMFWAADGQLRSRTSTDYINGFTGGPATDESQRRRRILDVDVTGDVAIAKAELDYPQVRLVDYFILVRSGGDWKIVSKAFHRFPKTTPSR